MKGNTLDKLFQNKLGGMEANPTEDAWNQINEALQSNRRKNYSKWYLSLAAAITLMATVSITWIQLNKETTTTISQVVPSEIISDENSTGSMNTVAAIEPELQTPENKNISNVDNLKKSSITAPLKNNLISVEQIKPDNQLPDLNNSVAVAISINPSSPGVSVKLSGIDLDFYPMFSPDAPRADNSGLKKAFNYALKIKNGEEVLFDVKKAKQDLFTFAKQKLKTEENSQLNFD